MEPNNIIYISIRKSWFNIKNLGCYKGTISVQYLINSLSSTFTRMEYWWIIIRINMEW